MTPPDDTRRRQTTRRDAASTHRQGPVAHSQAPTGPRPRRTAGTGTPAAGSTLPGTAPRTTVGGTGTPRVPRQRVVEQPTRRPSSRARAGLATAGAPPRSAGSPATDAAAPSPKRRQTLVLVAVLALLAVLAGRLVQVQVIEGPALAEAAFTGRLTTVTIPADRGRILDANGDELAGSVERWNIHVNQIQVKQARRTAEQVSQDAAVLSELLDLPAGELGAAILGGEEPRGFVYLAKGVAPEVYEKVMDQGIVGIGGERTTERVYPQGDTAGNVIGFVGSEGFGQAGLEMVHDDVLTGTDGSETFERGGRSGQRIPTGEREMTPAVPGKDLVLTIDHDLQYIVQDALNRQVAKTGAQFGMVEVRDVVTGEILALADSGSVDPNEPGETDAPDRGSRAVEVVYEPGSTAKVITMAALLETGLATPTTEFVVPDRYTVPNGESFKDSHPHEKLKLTLTGILAQSSNTGTVMAGQHLPTQVRHDYLRKFGFGETTGLGLPGESAGLLSDADDWDGRSAYSVLFGQAVGVTTLQTTGVFATIANGGRSVAPHLVKGTMDADGVLTPAAVAEPEQVISEETADTVLRMLESAVADGTGSSAAVPGYRIAGKTGTAQAFEGDGVIKIVASFVGIAPADDPRIVVNVALYDPKTSIYGGAVAAPLFKEVTGHALQYLGIPPSGEKASLFPTTYE